MRLIVAIHPTDDNYDERAELLGQAIDPQRTEIVPSRALRGWMVGKVAFQEPYPILDGQATPALFFLGVRVQDVEA